MRPVFFPNIFYERKVFRQIEKMMIKKVILLFNFSLTNNQSPVILCDSQIHSKMQRRIKNERLFLIFIGQDSFSLYFTFQRSNYLACASLKNLNNICRLAMYSIVYNMLVLGKTPPKGDNKSQQMDFTHPGSSNDVKDSSSEPLLQNASIDELKKPSASLFQLMKIERPGKCQTNRKRSVEAPRCRCKMSRCIRYYCDCFNAGLVCGRDCSCQDCQNNLDNQQLLLKRQKSKSKDKGCFCTKSNCLKKYCVCFSQGGKCKPTCKCKNCKNIPQETSQHKEESLHQSQDRIDVKEDLSEHVSPLDGSSCLRMEEQQFNEVEEKEKQIWDYLIEQ